MKAICTGAISKGKIKPQWSAWVLAIAPIARVEVPQEVEKGKRSWSLGSEP